MRSDRCSCVSVAPFRGTPGVAAVAHELDTHLSASALASSPLLERVGGASGSGWRWQWPLLAFLLLSGLCFLGLAWRLAQPLLLDTQVLSAPAVPALPPAPVRFADGSWAELHGATSVVYTEEMSRERVRVRLAGGARFDIVPNPERSFVVTTGQVVVRVLGTAFSLDEEAGRTRIMVERGRVQVMWHNGATLLSAGQGGFFPPADAPALVTTARFAVYEEKAVSEAGKHKAKRRSKTRAKAAALVSRR
jgi:ferric-dicitrate binding protein FerR (iron transport regulator)